MSFLEFECRLVEILASSFKGRDRVNYLCVVMLSLWHYKRYYKLQKCGSGGGAIDNFALVARKSLARNLYFSFHSVINQILVRNQNLTTCAVGG